GPRGASRRFPGGVVLVRAWVLFPWFLVSFSLYGFSESTTLSLELLFRFFLCALHDYVSSSHRDVACRERKAPACLQTRWSFHIPTRCWITSPRERTGYCQRGL